MIKLIELGAIELIVRKTHNPKTLTKCNTNERITYTLFMLIGTFIGYFILKSINKPLPLLESFAVVSSVVATYYMIVNKIDTWIIWLLSDIFCAIKYFILPQHHEIFIFSLNALCIFLAIVSYTKWTKILKRNYQFKQN